jgi:signal transduction histidine kinase
VAKPTIRSSSPDAAAPTEVKSAQTPAFIHFRTLVWGGRDYQPKPLESAGTSASSDAVRNHRYAAIALPQNGKTLTARFGPPDGSPRSAVRLRYKLQGYDSEWRDLDRASMHVVLKFSDINKIPVSRAEFQSSGNLVGWTETMATSKLTLRTERVVVPERAAWMDIWIDSGGREEVTGVWLVDDLKVFKTQAGEPSRQLLFEEGFEAGRDLNQPRGDPANWVRDGRALEGATVWTGLPALGRHALMILDGNPNDYSAWRLKDPKLVPVVPGLTLEVEWAEVFSVGMGRVGEAGYPELPSGHYQLRLQEVSAMGVPTGEEAVLPLIIAPPFYDNLWFRAAVVVSLLAFGLGLERLRARRRMRRKLEKLERGQALEKERARIARDIHDDLGTVLSRISMVGEFALLEALPGSRQRQRLSEICEASRELTRSMEEIVWAQDPKHDSLDNMTSYFCSFASDLLLVAKIACRLDIPMDHPNIPIDAEQRHELFLVFKESLNNIIKHAAASEVRISLNLQDHVIHLVIEDNGRGFHSAKFPDGKGNGLLNMKNRLLRVGGSVEIHSGLAKGTRVEISLPIPHQP